MKTPIACYCISNVASLNIYDIEYDINDRVLVGLNSNETEWCEIETEFDEYDEYSKNYFMWGETKFYLEEFSKL